MNDTCNDRFKVLRKSLNMSQSEYGKILGLTVSGVSDIERGKRNVTEKHIKFLCMEALNGKYLNEEWLRTGEGEMFRQLPEEDETAAYVSGLLEEPDNPLYILIKEIMHTYDELSPKSQETLRDFSAKLRKNLETKKEG